MSGLRRLSDVALSGGAAGATAGQAPSYNSSTGHFTPAAPKYDPRSGLYNATETSLKFARAAAARASSGGADLKIRCTGDSITAGQTSTAPGSTTSYPARLRARLTASGRFGTVRNGPVYPNDAANAQLTRDSRITSVGTGWSPGSNGFGGSLSATAPSGLVRVTPDQNVDTFVVAWARYGATASLTFSVDGAAASTQSVNGSAAVGSTTISAGAVGAHTLDIGATGAQVWVYMIDAYDSTQVGGCRLAKCGQPGASTGSFGTDLGFGGLSAGWAGWLPDIDVIHLGTNDASSSFNQAAYITALTALVTKARANSADPIIVAPIPAGPAYGAANHPALVAACYSVADAQNAALIDLDARWLSNATTMNAAPYLFMAGDLTHCTDKGYADMGTAVANALLSVL